MNFHTYQLKSERAYRVVIKNLHYSTNINEIKEEIENLGHKVRNIINIRHKITKQPLSMFFVDLEPNTTNKFIYELKHINNALVKVEPPKKNFTIVQCQRCQQFGHTKSYCTKINKCVKCGEEHLSSMCAKGNDIPARCANCNKTHPASYRGCEVYQDLITKKKKISFRTIRESNPFLYSDSNFPTLGNVTSDTAPNNNTNRQRFQSYAYTARTTNPAINSATNLDKIEMLLNKQLELTSNLINMMTLLMNKLCN